MAFNYLISPKNKNSLSKCITYKKGKYSFSITRTWSNCTILVDKKPVIKKTEDSQYTILKKFEFKENEFNYKEKIIFSDNFQIEDKKKVKKLIKNSDLYLDENHGWKESKEIYTIVGEFECRKVPVNELTLVTPEIEIVEEKIDKNKFKEYKNNGIPFEEYLDIDGNSELCSPVMSDSTSLHLNENSELSNLVRKLYKKELEIIKKSKLGHKITKNKNPFHAVFIERWVKRSWYKLKIYEDFDENKLEISISKFYTIGTNECFETFNLSYDGKDFEFIENLGSDSENSYLVDNKGKCFPFEVLEEEWDDDSKD